MKYLAILLVAVAAISCGRKKDVQLPPAQGPGAAALPVLPVIPKDDGAGATAIAPTEGRATGTTYPRAEAQIGPKGQGLIERVFVREGDRVKRGTVLFRQDGRDAELRVAQAKAALSAARVEAKAAETEGNRAKTLFDKGAATQMQWDQLQARMEGARVGVEQAEVAVSIAEKSLSDTTIRSPIDGLVTAKLKSEGEMVTMMPPTVVLVVQDQSIIELRFRLPENRLSQLKRGDVVTARFDALGATRQAKVTRISPAVDARTRTVEVVAEIPNLDGEMKSGLLAQVELAKAAASSPTASAEGIAPSTGARHEAR